MHNRNTNNFFRSASCGLIALLLLAFTVEATSAAQEKAVNKIEVKDGKVYVNGEMVKELEDADRPLILLGENSDDGHAMSFFSSDDDHSGNEFVVGKTSVGLGKVFEFDGDNKKVNFFSQEGNVELTGDHMKKMRWFGGSSGDFSEAEHLFRQSSGANNMLYSGRAESDEIRKLEMESHQLARAYRTAEETEKNGLADDLRRILEKIFDLKEEAMTERLSIMSTELNKLTERLDERRSSKDDIVSRRYQELIGEKDSLAW